VEIEVQLKKKAKSVVASAIFKKTSEKRRNAKKKFSKKT